MIEMKEKNVELLLPYYYAYGKETAEQKKKALKDYFHIEGVPLKIIEQLKGNKPEFDLKDAQNESPNHKEMISIIKKHKGSLLCGYVIPLTSGRDDARVSFDTIYLKTDELTARQLSMTDVSQPDEFDEIEFKGKKYFRLWWD
jgi:hypothetical protein